MVRQSQAKPLRVGFLGTGYISDWHARALHSVAGAALVAVCDKDLPRAEAFARRHGGVRAYESLEAMLRSEEPRLDAVHVLLPANLHARAALALIEQQTHVLLEKPMATSVAECNELLEQAKARQVAVGVSHNFLFAPVYESLREDLKSGRLGRPDHVNIVWNRGLDQLQSGPFDLWMLRDPRHILFEIGPHCLAPVLDLLGTAAILGVHASDRILLPGQRLFFRRWSITAEAGSVGVSVLLSFAPGFTEQSIHVRGSLAAATVDFERNTYLRHEHTRYGLDIDRYRMLRRETGSLSAQARHSFTQYALSKLKLSSAGSPYGRSIARALQAFYAGLGTKLDSRVGPELGADVIRLCQVIGEMGAGVPDPANVGVDDLEVRAVAEVARDESPAEILILGATGFIGQELARQLRAEGRRIRLLVRNPGACPRIFGVPEWRSSGEIWCGPKTWTGPSPAARWFTILPGQM